VNAAVAGEETIGEQQLKQGAAAEADTIHYLQRAKLL